MFDEFLNAILSGMPSGVASGIAGETSHGIRKWLNQFKYRIIFLTTTLFVFGGEVIVGVIRTGFRKTIEAISLGDFEPLYFFLPIVAGLFATFIAFLGSLDAIIENKEGSKDDMPTPN
jgi:hypothetical protein